MTTAYTSLLGLALPVQGELSGTWGDTVNNSITSLLDTSVAGTTNVSTDTDVTLTTTTGAANTARQAILLFSGARTALRTVTAPAQSKIYTVINATTGGFAVKLVGAGPTTGLTIPNGASAVVAWNGSDFVEIGSGSIGNLVVNGTLTVTGATTLQSTLAVTGNITNTAGTANGVAYLNGSKVVTSGSALTFDGTKLSTSTFAAGLTTASSFVSRLTNVSNEFALYAANGVSTGNSGDVKATIGLYYSDTLANLNGGIQFTRGGGGTDGWMNFFASGSEQMRLTSTGLGIGTSSILSKLVVSNGSSKNFEVQPGATTYLLAYDRAASDYLNLDISGKLITFSTNNGAEKMRLDSSGNLGLGVTPSASVWKSFEIGANGSSITSAGSNDIRLFSNAFWNGSSYRYVNTAASGSYVINTGAHYWLTAASGTAGNAITFTQAMTLDASGNLGIGTSSVNTRLHVVGLNQTNGTAEFTPNASKGSNASYVHYGTNGDWYIRSASLSGNVNIQDTGGNVGIGTSSPVSPLTVAGTASVNWLGPGSSTGTATIGTQGTGGSLLVQTPSVNASYASGFGVDGTYSGGKSVINLKALGTSSGGPYSADMAFFTSTNTTLSEKMRLDSSGNLGLGVTPSAWGSAYKVIDAQSNGGSFGASGYAPFVACNAYQNGTNWIYKGSSFAPSYYSQFNGSHIWYNAPTGTAGNAITFTQAMTLDASGRLGVGRTSVGAQFDVLGASSTSAMRIVGNSGASIYVDLSGGGDNYYDATNHIFRNASGTERARIASNGSFLLGTTTAPSDANSLAIGNIAAGGNPQQGVVITPSGIQVNGHANGTSSGTVYIYFNYAGGTIGSISQNGTTGTLYNTSSDYRLKNITGSLTGYKERLMSLQPKQGTWIADGSEFRGFLAHDFAGPYRASVNGEKDAVDAEGNPVMQSMQASSSEVMADLVALVQEQQAIIETLKARLDAANL